MHSHAQAMRLRASSASSSSSRPGQAAAGCRQFRHPSDTPVCRPTAQRSLRQQQLPQQQQTQQQRRGSSRPRLGCAAAALDEAPPQPAAAAAPAAAAGAAAAKLADLPTQPIINNQGRVDPPSSPGAAAWVFAVYDEAQKLQFIGFSRGLRASLRTVLGRRPDKAHFYKALPLPELDQDAMMATRQAWFDECGAPPPGNKLALERKAWQSAVDAGAISARAKPAAAADKARELQAALRARGCCEEFVPDPDLLVEGQVDFLPPAGDNAAAAAAAAAASASAAASAGRLVRSATAVVDGQAKQFSVEYEAKVATKGGCFVDVKVSFDHMDTRHRIVVGRAYYEPYGLPPEAAVEAALSLLLSLKLPRHLDGMLTSGDFPVNYFTLGEVEQWYGEAFAATFLHVTGAELADGSGSFWRMNKVHDYGPKLEDAGNLGGAMSAGGLGRYGG